jgi:hypothetical protein
LAKLIGNNDAGNTAKMLKYLGIKLEKLSESQTKSYIQDRKKLPESPNTSYKQGWFESKTGNRYFYRSSYELRFIEFLEENSICFEMENPYKYFDSQQNKDRCALPDFIVGNIIIEIKSNYTFDSVNMKDKFLAYIEQGFRPMLQLEFKYYEMVHLEFVLMEDLLSML